MLLLGLLAALSGCGPAGRVDDASPGDRAFGDRAATAAKARPGRGVVRVRTGRRPAPPPGEAVLDASLLLPGDTPWDDARAGLEAAVDHGAERVVLSDPLLPAGGQLVWHPPRPLPGEGRPDFEVEAKLSLEDGVPCVDVWVRGSAWVARYGCDSPTWRRLDGWGSDAWPAFATLLDEALAAVGGEAQRLAVSVSVASAARSRARWSDVRPLAEQAILTRAAVVSLLPARAAPTRRLLSTEASLVWLAAHQADDGRWAAAGFGEVCDGNPMRRAAADGEGHAGYDVGATGLALLAFLGAGYTNRGRHPFARTVGRGLRFLKEHQDEDGLFADPGGPWFAEQQAIAALALLEAYGMTGSPLFRGAAQRGVGALTGGFGSAARDGLAALGFTMAALASAELVNEDARQREREPPLRLDDGLADEIHFRCLSLSASGRPDEAAVGLLGRILLGGEPARGEELHAVAEGVLRQPPAPAQDAFHELFGTLAVFRVGREPWKRWNEQLKAAVIGTQRSDGAACCYRGSWDPTGRGGERFGRVGATALRTLSTEVYYRYDRVFGTR